MEKFKNITIRQRHSLLREYQEILQRDITYPLKTFCSVKNIKYTSMKSWMQSRLGITVHLLKNKINEEIERSTSKESLEFIQVVPQRISMLKREGIEMSVEEVYSSRSIYGVNIVCPSGMSINVKECTVDNLAFLMKSL